MRLLLAVVGAAAVVAGLVVATREIGELAHGASLLPSLLAAALATFVMLGGMQLVRGAWRGRIFVRRTRFRRSRDQQRR